MAETKITEFNSLFTKYERQKTLRAHDVVSIANLARENNKVTYGYELDITSPYYIKVEVYGSGLSTDGLGINYSEFEKVKESEYQEFLKKYIGEGIDPIYFTCESITMHQDTKLVDSVKIKKN